MPNLVDDLGMISLNDVLNDSVEFIRIELVPDDAFVW